MKPRLILAALAAAFIPAAPAVAQTFPTDDPVIRQIWEQGMERSHVYDLAQTLMDSIGPRLTGSPGHEAGNRWLVETYRSWGVEARTEQYGTWRRWRRGVTHVDLVEPRVRTLESTQLAWTAGTGGETVRGEVVVFPELASAQAFEAWLPNVAGKFVAISYPQPTCRPDENWKEHAMAGSFERLAADREAGQAAWDDHIRRAGFDPSTRRSIFPLAQRLEAAGAAGVLTSRWSEGWGVQKVFSGGTESVPTLDVSCEDYGLVVRLAHNGQGPVLDVMVEAEFLGEGPVFNAVAEIPGTELPDEYVMLSAHFDSWDAGSGATDNGTGTITMLEAMRILKEVYPTPKRTILVGHWGGEEQGLNGSRGFAADHPEVIEGLQALFNQDNGTGQVVHIDAQGLTEASGSWARWLTRIPTEITGQIQLEFPGVPATGGSDHASFICYGAPAFRLRSEDFDYRMYTWHTNRDTFDKVSMDNLRNNATLTAMLVYMASEDPERTPRMRRADGWIDDDGEVLSWPACTPSRRSWAERRR